jgi:hypothetical protein
VHGRDGRVETWATIQSEQALFHPVVHFLLGCISNIKMDGISGQPVFVVVAALVKKNKIVPGINIPKDVVDVIHNTNICGCHTRCARNVEEWVRRMVRLPGAHDDLQIQCAIIGATVLGNAQDPAFRPDRTIGNGAGSEFDGWLWRCCIGGQRFYWSHCTGSKENQHHENGKRGMDFVLGS